MKFSWIQLVAVLFIALFSCTSNPSEEEKKTPLVPEEKPAANTHTIYGSFPDYKETKVFLLKLNRSGADTLAKVVTDANGEYEINVVVDKNGLYNLICSDVMAMVFTDTTEIGVSYNNQGWSFSNSRETQLYYAYNKLNAGFVASFSEMQKEYQMAVEKSDMATIEYIKLQYDSVSTRAQNLQKDFIRANSPSYTAYMGLIDLLKSQSVDAHIAFLSEIKPLYVGSGYVFEEDLVNRIESIERLALGALAPDFTLPTPEGEMLSLSSLRGKYVLIDFWASWCGPCVQEIPNLKKAYNDYSDKGFEILGVSLDKSKPNWVDAIKRHEMTWPQVSDLKQWESMVNPLYNISGIPFAVLLDPEGRIVAKNLRGAALEEKLSEIFD